MKILVVGANGQVGKLLVDLLSAKEEYEPVAMIRKVEQQAHFQELGVTTLRGDLEWSEGKLAEAMARVEPDAVVFTAGSGAKTGADKTLLIDLDGAVKIMEACMENEVKRFVMVSAIGVHERKNWLPALAPYCVAKHYADEVLMDSDLDWTIVRPGKLLNDAGTGRVEIKETLKRDSIPRADVASVIVSVLDSPHTVGMAFDVVSGSTPISEAVAGLR